MVDGIVGEKSKKCLENILLPKSIKSKEALDVSVDSFSERLRYKATAGFIEAYMRGESVREEIKEGYFDVLRRQRNYTMYLDHPLIIAIQRKAHGNGRHGGTAGEGRCPGAGGAALCAGHAPGQYAVYAGGPRTIAAGGVSGHEGCTVMPQIRPITDLRNTAEISELFHAKSEPIYITKNGYGDLVIMSIETFENMLDTNQTDIVISEAEREYKNTGTLIDDREGLSTLRRKHFG